MRFTGNYDPAAMYLPGDIALHDDGALMRFDLDEWQVLNTFRGEYVEGVEYDAGDVVVRGGALWISTPHEAIDTWTCIAGNGGGDV